MAVTIGSVTTAVEATMPPGGNPRLIALSIAR
jgi:hypothetical protein